MIQPKRTYGDKIMETLEKIGLSEQEREKIFSYVSGERGEEALQGLTARDFYQLAETQLEAAAALFSHFCDRHSEEAKKMLRVLFTLGLQLYERGEGLLGTEAGRVAFGCGRDRGQKQ